MTLKEKREGHLYPTHTTDKKDVNVDQKLGSKGSRTNCGSDLREDR